MTAFAGLGTDEILMLSLVWEDKDEPHVVIGKAKDIQIIAWFLREYCLRNSLSLTDLNSIKAFDLRTGGRYDPFTLLPIFTKTQKSDEDSLAKEDAVAENPIYGEYGDGRHS